MSRIEKPRDLTAVLTVFGSIRYVRRSELNRVQVPLYTERGEAFADLSDADLARECADCPDVARTIHRLNIAAAD